ncbi:MAG: lipopolysaccharide biosynthesis protein [Bauldia sp.]|nr:lipopolysaccharide biosynthesis protein [Bauldia sp.]
MGISFAGVAGRIGPEPLRRRLVAFGGALDGIVAGRDDRAVSQRVALVAFVTRVVSAIIALGSQALMARWMGEHEYGILVVVWVAAIIVGGLACLGFQISVVRFIPEYLERKQTGLLRGIIVGARVYGFTVATVLALVGAAGLYFFPGVVSNEHVMPFYLAAICLPMLAVGEIQDGIARAFNWAKIALWPTYIYRPLLILFFMWLAIRLGSAADAVTAMYASIAATWLMTAFQGWQLRRRLKTRIEPLKRVYTLLPWVAVSLPIFLVEGFFNLLTNVDILIVGALMVPEDAAIYFATVKTLALVHFVYFAVRAGAAARFSHYYVAGDRSRLESFLRDTLHWTFWPSLAVSGLLLLFGHFLLSLFGASFTSGYPLLFIFILGLLARASVGPAESLLTMAGQQRITAALYFGVFFVNVALNFLLIPLIGLKGAAIATAVSLTLEAIALVIVVRIRLGINSWIGFNLLPAHRAAEAR